MVSGILISQIGYDKFDPMRGMFRAEVKDFFSGTPHFLIKRSENIVSKGEAEYFGEVWKNHWWVMDFSGLDTGEYIIELYDDDKLVDNDIFEVGDCIIWNKTAIPVGIEQFEARAEKARNNVGWKDCGATLRESVSHAIALIGLYDFALMGYEWLSNEQCDRLIAQLMHGADYLMLLANRAVSMGLQKGSMYHEIPEHFLVLPRGIAQSVIAWTKVSKLTADNYPKRSLKYLQQATDSFDYFLDGLKPHSSKGFSNSNNGAPADYVKPDEWQTRDLILWLWGAYELYTAGVDKYKDVIIKLADMIMDRQVKVDEAEGGYYGHFFAYSDRVFTEKANIHHHVGCDTGAIFPYYITVFMDLYRRFSEHENADKWRKTVHDFAYGFFLPACKTNPFYLIPEGYFTGEGILNFAGPWHGINATIAFGANLALRLEQETGNYEFRQIAVGNIQWIAGLNIGVVDGSFDSCVKYKPTIGEGKVQSVSQIYKIGRNYVSCWSDIVGTIVNGYSVNPQFRLEIPPTQDVDYPINYTDEDWIPHSAAFLGAVSQLRMIRYFDEPEQKYY